jgi:uncharacterized protein YkwD
MQHKSASNHKLKIVFSMLGVFVLVAGIVLTLKQASNQQEQRTHAAGDCTVNATQMAIKPEEQTMFDLINAYRTQNGKPVLSWSDALKRPSAWLSADMLTSRNLSHTDSLGRTLETRLPDCGFPISTRYGENIANGAPNASDIVTAWKNSPPHNTIMLDTAYTQGAVSMALDTTGQIAFWTLDVGGARDTVTLNPSTGPTITIPGTTLIPTISNGQTTIMPTITTPATTTQPNTPSPTSGKVSVDMQIGIKVKITGIGTGGNLYPKHLSRHVNVIVYGTGVEPVATGNAFLPFDGLNYFTGVIHLGKLNEGSYFVKIVSDNTLQTLAKPEFQNLSGDHMNDIPPVTLVQGDTTNDNIINIADFNAALPCFQNKRCDTASNIDFNDDGLTDVTDYNLFLQGFLQAQGN